VIDARCELAGCAFVVVRRGRSAHGADAASEA
jgi:hypothetical protein